TFSSSSTASRSSPLRRSTVSTCSPGCCRSWGCSARLPCSVWRRGGGAGGDRMPRCRPCSRRTARARWTQSSSAGSTRRSRGSTSASSDGLPGGALMAGQIPVAFLAGLLSFVAPCVLPLVPGYLSAVSAVEAGRLGEPGTTRRVLIGSLPFVAGFTVLFVALGAGAGLIGNSVSLNSTRVQAVAGFVVVLFGLAFIGLLPFPERLVAPRPGGGARGGGPGRLLRGALAGFGGPAVGGAPGVG